MGITLKDRFYMIFMVQFCGSPYVDIVLLVFIRGRVYWLYCDVYRIQYLKFIHYSVGH